MDIGSGHNPYPRANVLLERFVEDNSHRSGSINIPNDKLFFSYDGDIFPFKDKEFDYSTCIHVLEHVEKPGLFLDEIARVSARGYIEIPSFIGEMIFPKRSHKWVALEIKNQIVLVEKIRIPFHTFWGDLFQKHVAPNSIEFRVFLRTYHSLLSVNYEWDQNIEYLINPDEEEYLKYFYNTWDENIINELIKNGKKSRREKIYCYLRANLSVITDFLKTNAYKQR